MSLLSTNQATKRIVVHALHKSASMFLFKFFGRLAKQKNLPFYSSNNTPPDDRPEDELVEPSFCLCPVRTFSVDAKPESKAPAYRIFHVRDPRDMLVSEYFSFGWTHQTGTSNLDARRREIQNMTIDEYVINQPEFSNWPLHEKFQPLLDRVLDPNRELIVKYETMVTRFPTWASKSIQPFGFRFPRLTVGKLAWRYRNEFIPSSEPNAHKRRITPGDFRNQLQPETIEILNDRFAESLVKLGYNP